MKRDILQNFKPITSNVKRLQLMTSSAFKGFKDPEDAAHVSDLTDLSSMNTLRWIRLKMKETNEGSDILENKPRISLETLNYINLQKLDKESLGYRYYQYMNRNNFSPDLRPVVKYIPDFELAYICQRYKETHDFYHVLLNYDRSVLDEIAVKYFEALHLRLPSASFAALFAPFSISLHNNLILFSKYLPNIVVNAENCKFLMSINFENRLNQNIDELRKELNIIPMI